MLPSRQNILLFFILILLASCSDDSPEPDSRLFKMGFTTWPYDNSLEDVDDTYAFIESNADIYAEHIDNRIPWKAWMNDDPLPVDFFNEISVRANRRIPDQELLLSVSLFNLNRDELALDFDGTVPAYISLDDPHIEDAYYEHINYLVTELQPNYLVIAIEVNEFRLKAESKWSAYTRLIQNVTNRIKNRYPTLSISESVSLHNLYEPNIENPEAYINDIIEHMNQLDFAAISFYPFLKDQNSIEEFQATLDFLHDRITVPIAFAETSHIAEDLDISNYNLFIPGNETEQNNYLKSLLSNAEEQDYEFIIWWSHRDFDTLWETFPVDLKDLGRLWRDSGLLDENGNERLSFSTWESVYE